MRTRWHNTTAEGEPEINVLNQRAQSQEEKILDFFNQYPGKAFTPYQIQDFVLPDAMITSVRRAISNLTREGKLIKTGDKIKEKQGISNYTWRLTPTEPVQTQLF